MVKKTGKRLAGWNRQLFELRHFCFSTAQEFDEWCGGYPYVPEVSQALARAAKFFHLDEKKAVHRNLLLYILADIFFGDPRWTGRPKRKTRWHEKALAQLAHDCDEVRKNKHGTSDKKAAEIIKKLHPERYRHTSSEMIRQRLPKARKAVEARRLRKRPRESFNNDLDYLVSKYGFRDPVE
jgi:hypothetical protein